MPSMVEDVAVFDTLTAAKAATIPAGIKAVQTFAYNQSDDGGGATYCRLQAQPTDAANRGYFKDAAGTWFALTSLDANVKMFGCLGDGATNDQDPFQDALNYAFGVLYTNLYVPAGCYKVNSLKMPGRTGCDLLTETQVLPDDRHKRLKLFGQGIGEGYAIKPFTEVGGTKIIGGENQIVLNVDNCYDRVASSGMEICDLAFISTGDENPNPVVRLRITQNSSFHHNIVYQAGIGDGLHIEMAYQADIAWNRIFNKWADLLTSNRTGIGIRLFNKYSPSQITIRNNTSRTFEHAGIFGDANGSHAEWQLLVMYNEASECTNGWTLHQCNGALVTGNYIEGPQGGFGFRDLSQEVNYISNFIFEGCSVGFDFSDPKCRGPKVSNCTVKLGNKAGAVGIHVVNDATFDWCYSITDNLFEIADNTPGAIGIHIQGESASVNISGNGFNPRQMGWGGLNSHKIKVDVADPGLTGLVQYSEDPTFVAYQAINNGQITFSSGTLKHTDFSGQTLNIGPRNYYVIDTCARDTNGSITCYAESFNRIVRSASGDTTQVTLRLVDANVSVTQSGSVQLAGGATFTGPGAITFAVTRIGANDYAYELSRTSY